MLFIRVPKYTMLKDRDYDVNTIYYRSPVPPNTPGVGESLRGVVWICVIVGEECEVYCEDV